MARRLKLGTIKESARAANETGNPVSLSGRCAMFTESDIVHLHQKGHTSRAHRCRYPSSDLPELPRRHRLEQVGRRLAATLGLDSKRIMVPSHGRTLGAIGASLRAHSVIGVASSHDMPGHIPVATLGVDIGSANTKGRPIQWRASAVTCAVDARSESRNAACRL